jgi:plastocyanin
MGHMRLAACHLAIAATVLFAATPARAKGGTIKGKVDVTPVRYLEDTVVYVKEVKGRYSPRTHALDQKGMRFLPHIVTVTVGDTVHFFNHDNVAHEIYSPDGEGYNLGFFKQGEERTYRFTRTGVYSQQCTIHPEMLAYIFVGQNPYAAAVDMKGGYEIRDVPPGTYRLAVWNAKLQTPERTVVVAAGEVRHENLSLQR